MLTLLKTVGRITYIVLVQTLNNAQSIWLCWSRFNASSDNLGHFRGSLHTHPFDWHWQTKQYWKMYKNCFTSLLCFVNTLVSVWLIVSVTTGSKRASDDGQDVDTEDNGHAVKRSRQQSDIHAELKILLPSRVSTLQLPFSMC